MILAFLTFFLALHDSTDITDQTMGDDTDQRASKRARVDNDDASQPEPAASKTVAESANGQPAEAKHVNGDKAEKLEVVDEEEDDDPYGLNEASNGQSGDSAAPAGDLYLDTVSFAGRMLLKHYKLTSTSVDQPERTGFRLREALLSQLIQHQRLCLSRLRKVLPRSRQVITRLCAFYTRGSSRFCEPSDPQCKLKCDQKLD